MKRIIKGISIFAVIALTLIFTYPSNAYAVTEQTPYANVYNTQNLTPSKNYKYNSFDYVIDKYDINIVVNENNTFNVTEKITAYFNVPKHGIFRTIPLKNKITRLDGTTSTKRAKITNISVDNKYTTSRENGNYKLKIGSADQTLTGEQTYNIKYTYDLGKDPVKNYDELYYDIIGNEWDTVVGNVTFTITMPKEFDSSKLGFSSGIKGSTNSSNVNYNLNGNTITGSYNRILMAKEGLTVRCELPEGYFVSPTSTIKPIDFVVILIPIIFLTLTILIWYKFGRDDQVIETVEFYPPEGFNSLEVGYLYKGKANNKDVTSLIIYLANKGYIKISEIEEKSLFTTTKAFKITKLKEYDGNNSNERIFLKGLFTKSSTSSLFLTENDKTNNNTELNEVTLMDLYDKFYSTVKEILSNINNEENREKIFENPLSIASVSVVLMIIAIYCLITILPITKYGESFLMFPSILFPSLGFTTMFIMMIIKTETYYNARGKERSSSLPMKICGLFVGICFGGMPWAYMVLPSLLENSVYLIGYIVGLVCVFGMLLCLKYMPKRTPYGNEILGKIKGFKNFLETAEKDKLEAMVMQNPTYFYDILPYTYVLGVSDKWIKKFEAITMQAPSWYDSTDIFDMAAFGTFMESTMVSAQSTLSSSSFSSSGGGSGGGSSGGGSGGGGGGSW